MIKLKVASTLVYKIPVDTRSSADILTWDCIQKLKYSERDIIPPHAPDLGVQGPNHQSYRDHQAPLTIWLFRAS